MSNTNVARRGKQFRLRVAIILAGGLLLASASGSAAADPTGTVAPKGSQVANGQPPNDRQVSILSSDGQVIVAAKLDTANQVQLAAGGSDGGFAVQAASSDSLWTFARQQANGYYCGPAAGQVASNFSWGYN